MKEAYKVTLGLMLILILVGGHACYEGGDGGNLSINPGPTVVGSANIVQETRSVTGATGVDLRGVANLTIEQGAPEELILQTDDNLMDLIITVVQGGVLVICSDPTVTLQPSQRMEAHLTLSSIDSNAW